MSAGVRKNVVSRRSDIKCGIYVTQQLCISPFSKFPIFRFLKYTRKIWNNCLNNNIAPKFSNKRGCQLNYFHSRKYNLHEINTVCIISFAAYGSSDNMKSTIPNRNTRITRVQAKIGSTGGVSFTPHRVARWISPQ